MRIFLVLICSLALACAVAGAQEEKGKKKEQKKGPQTGQVSQPGGKPTGAGKPTGVGKPTEVGKAKGTGKPTGAGKPTGVGKSGQATQQTEVGKPAGKGKGKGPEGGKPTEVGKAGGKGKPAEVGKATGAGKPIGAGKATEAGTATTAGKTTATGKATATGKQFKPQRFNLPTKTTPTKVTAVNFQQGRHIEGSQNWQGSNYQVFRNYKSEWHDQGWWRNHYNNRVVFVYGGWYAWNAGYWIPAWGYAPNAYYAYDGPIYGYNNLPPDQVIANVQSALQQQGYYQGEVDGLLGPQTRGAIADYQRANGLEETAAIDQPTLESLGMS
jgi:Putative peptidoglycan binding domain